MKRRLLSAVSVLIGVLVGSVFLTLLDWSAYRILHGAGLDPNTMTFWLWWTTGMTVLFFPFGWWAGRTAARGDAPPHD